MLRGGKNGHIHANLRDDANSGKGLDTQRRHNEVKLGKIFLSDGQDKRVQIGLAQFKAVHVGTDDAEFFGLFHTHLSVRSGLDFLNWCFDSLVEEWSYMKGFVAS